MKKIILLLVFIPLISISQDIKNSSFAGIVLRKGLSDLRKQQMKLKELEYPVEITINNLQKNQISATIKYHEGGVEANLTFVSTTVDDKYIFHEKITKGRDGSTDNGTVILELINNDQVLFRWYFPSGNLGEEGVLSKIYSSVY